MSGGIAPNIPTKAAPDVAYRLPATSPGCPPAPQYRTTRREIGRYGASSVPDRHLEDGPLRIASLGLVRLDGDGEREAGVVVVEHSGGKVLLSLTEEKGHTGSKAAERVH